MLIALLECLYVVIHINKQGSVSTLYALTHNDALIQKTLYPIISQLYT